MLLLAWLLIGTLTNLYYFTSKFTKYVDMLESGEIKVINLFVGWVLTFFFWPISIYNNECRKK